MFSLFYIFVDVDDFRYAFGLFFESFWGTLGSLFVNNCTAGEPSAFEWIFEPGGRGPEFTVPPLGEGD